MDSQNINSSSSVSDINGKSQIQSIVDNAVESSKRPLNVTNTQKPLTGNLDFSGSNYRVLVKTTPISNSEAASKKYVDDSVGGGGSIKDRIVSTGGDGTVLVTEEEVAITLGNSLQCTISRNIQDGPTTVISAVTNDLKLDGLNVGLYTSDIGKLHVRETLTESTQQIRYSTGISAVNGQDLITKSQVTTIQDTLQSDINTRATKTELGDYLKKSEASDSITGYLKIEDAKTTYETIGAANQMKIDITSAYLTAIADQDIIKRKHLLTPDIYYWDATDKGGTMLEIRNVSTPLDPYSATNRGYVTDAIADAKTELETYADNVLHKNDQNVDLYPNRVILAGKNLQTQSNDVQVTGTYADSKLYVNSNEDGDFSNTVFLGGQLKDCYLRQTHAGQNDLFVIKQGPNILQMSDSHVNLNKPVSTGITTFADDELITAKWAQDRLDNKLNVTVALNNIEKPTDSVDMDNHKIINLADGVLDNDAVNRKQLVDYVAENAITQTDADTTYLKKSDAATTYETKTHAQNTYSTITDLSLLNTTIQSQLAGKMDVNGTYSKTEIDNKDAATLTSATTLVTTETTNRESAITDLDNAKISWQDPEDKSLIVASQLQLLDANGQPYSGAGSLTAVQGQLIVSEDAEICKPAGAADQENVWGSRQYATIGLITGTLTYNREAIETRDADTLLSAQTYTDGVIAGSGIVTTGSNTGFNTTKTIEVENSNGTVTGINVTDTETIVKGDLVGDGSQLDLSTLTNSQRQHYFPTCAFTDGRYASQSSLDTETTSRQNADINLQSQITTISNAGYQTSSQVADSIASSLTPYYTATQSDARFRGISAPFSSIVSSDSQSSLVAGTSNTGLQITASATQIGSIFKNGSAMQLQSTGSNTLNLVTGSTGSIGMGTAANSCGIYVSSGDDANADCYNLFQLGNGGGKTGLVLSNGHLAVGGFQVPYSTICAGSQNASMTMTLTPDSAATVAAGTANTIVQYSSTYSDVLAPLKTTFSKKVGYAGSVSMDQNNQFITKAYADQKLALSGGTMTGALNMNSQAITNLSDPTMSYHPVTLAYLQANNYTKTQTDATTVNTTRLVVNNDLDFANYLPTSNVSATSSYQLANKSYVDTAISNVTASTSQVYKITASADQTIPLSWKVAAQNGYWSKIKGSGAAYISSDAVPFLYDALDLAYQTLRIPFNAGYSLYNVYVKSVSFRRIDSKNNPFQKSYVQSANWATSQYDATSSYYLDLWKGNSVSDGASGHTYVMYVEVDVY